MLLLPSPNLSPLGSMAAMEAAGTLAPAHPGAFTDHMVRALAQELQTGTGLGTEAMCCEQGHVGRGL